MSENRILPFEAILSKSGESWVVGGVASNFFRDLDGDAIAPDAIARAIPAFMANRGPDGLKGGPLRLHHGFWERFLKQSINSLNIPYADQMGMLAAIALPLGRVTEMTVEPDGTTRWRGLLSQANPIAKVIWEMLKERLVHLGVSVGGKINATRPGRDVLGRPCTVICDVRLDELSITDNPANRLIESEAADNGAYIMALAKSLQTTVSPSPVDRFLEQVLGDDLSKAARQKLQEGATKQVNGVTYVLNKKRRWTRAEPRGKRSSTPWQATVGQMGQEAAQAQAKPTRKPRAKAAPQQLPLIPDGTPATVKPKAKKGKQWQSSPPAQAPSAAAGAAFGNLRPKGQPSKATVMGEGNIKAWADKNLEDEPKPKAKGKRKRSAEPGVADLSAKRDQKAKGEAKPKRSRKAKAEGGDMPPQAKGGELALTPKAGLESKPETSNSAPDEQLTGQAAIDQKYASENPSDADADNWLRDTLLERFNPSQEAVESEALLQMKKGFNVHEDFATGDSEKRKQYKNIKTKDQLYDAVLEKEDEWLSYIGGTVKPEHFGFQSDGYYRDYYAQKIEKIEDRIKVAKDEKTKARNIKKRDELIAERDEMLPPGQPLLGTQRAAEKNEYYSKTPKERKAILEAEWISTVQKIYKENEQKRSDILSGNKSKIKDYSREVVTRLDGFSDSGAMNDKDTWKKYLRNPQTIDRQVIKAHLQQAHQKGGGDASVLGLRSRKPTAQELKHAYRQAARANHPDQGGSREKFDQIRGAYERLMDEHYPDLKKSLIPYSPKTTMANVNRFLHKALGGSPGGEINSGSWRDTAIPSMGRGLNANSTNKPTGTKQVRMDSSSSDTAARGIGGKQPKAQRTYSSGGMPPTDVWGMTVGQLTRELSKCCGMTKDAWGSPETSGFLTDAAHGLVGLTESPHPELINFVRFLQYLNQFAQQIPHMDDYQASGTVAAMNTDLTKALGDFTETLSAELKGRALRPPGSPGVRGIDIQFPSQYIVYS